MASILSYTISVTAVFLGTLAYLVSRVKAGSDVREPPGALQSIPLVGHLIGLARKKFDYYVILSKQTNSPIFTISLLGQKIYVVTKPELIQAVQKQYKTLAFPPIEAKFASKVCGASPEAQAILYQNVNGDEGDFGLSMESNAAMRSALKPGASLDDMNRTMIKEVAKALEQIEPAKDQSRELKLFSWLRDLVTVATTRSVYGPMNPFEDKAIVDAFWAFESGLVSILLSPLPSIFARKPIAARNKVAKAFEAYYRAGGLDKASALAQYRYQASANNNVPLKDIARFEVGGSVALLVNTAPATFWTILLVYTCSGLVEEVRREIDACIETKVSSDTGTQTKSLDITTLKENCPLLLSAYQEVLRYCSMGTSVRDVVQDTQLDQWLLKKGAMLQLPSRVIHQDPSLWGEDVSHFDPRRFLPERKNNRPNDICFRAFGGGKTLCPGRHFATNEILAVAAVFIAKIDMTPVQGAWRLPTTQNTNAASVMLEPDHDIDVNIKMRRGYEDVKWDIQLRKSEKIFAMVTEDTA